MSTPAANSSNRAGVAAILVAVLVDAAFVVVFAMLGRAEHGGAIEATAVWQAAWPFLVALIVTWILAFVWRRPFSIVKSGLSLWIGTLALGMMLRVIFTDGGAALPFVLVAAAVLGLTLVGWRLAWWAVARLGGRTAKSQSHPR